MSISARKRYSGFTLIELLIVIGLIALVTGVLIPNFNQYIKNQNKRQAQDQIISDLRSVQNKALTGVLYDPDAADPVTHWGINFTKNDRFYNFFTMDTSQGNYNTACNAEVNKIVSRGLPSTVVIREDACILFSLDNGTAVDSSGSYPITVFVGYNGESGNKCFNIQVLKTGLVKGSGNQVACP